MPGTALSGAVEVWLLNVQKGAVVCGDGCEDKGAGREIRCVSEH